MRWTSGGGTLFTTQFSTVTDYLDHVHVAEELVRFDSDLNRLVAMKNSQARTPINLVQGEGMKQAFNSLWKAAHDGDLDQARLLLRRGSSVNMVTESHRSTPIMLAVRRNNVLMVKFLLENRADPTLVDADNKSAIQYAQEFDPRVRVLSDFIEKEAKKDKSFKAKVSPLTQKRLKKLLERLKVQSADFGRLVMDEVGKNQKILRMLLGAQSGRPQTASVAPSARIEALSASTKK